MYNVESFSDASWGDDRATRKSTSSGVISLNGILLCSLCRTQSAIALSSCESELHAANSIMCESIHLTQLPKFLVNDSSPKNSNAVMQKLFVDSSSAQAFIQRAGVGRMKHISIRMMFLQQLLRDQQFSLCRIPTKHNPADLNTKRSSKERRMYLGELIGLYQEEKGGGYEGDHIQRIHALMHVASCMGISSTLKRCSMSDFAGHGISYGETLDEIINVVSMPFSGFNSYIMDFVYVLNFVTLHLGRILVIFLLLCLCCRFRFGGDGVDTLLGRSSELLLDVVKCVMSPWFRRWSQRRAEVWSQRRQQCVRTQNRQGARYASEMVIWWNQQLRILNGIVYGFFEEEQGEDEAARQFRYRNSSLSEVSDQEEWMGYHHFESDDSPNGSENDGAGNTGRFNIWGDGGAQERPATSGSHGPDASGSEPDGEPDVFHELQVGRESALQAVMELYLSAVDRGDVENEVHFENQLNAINLM